MTADIDDILEENKRLDMINEDLCQENERLTTQTEELSMEVARLQNRLELLEEDYENAVREGRDAEESLVSLMDDLDEAREDKDYWMARTEEVRKELENEIAHLEITVLQRDILLEAYENVKSDVVWYTSSSS